MTLTPDEEAAVLDDLAHELDLIPPSRHPTDDEKRAALDAAIRRKETDA